MKATGIVRRIDELGRVVIPKEIRRTQRIRRGDPLEIFTTGDGVAPRFCASCATVGSAPVSFIRRSRSAVTFNPSSLIERLTLTVPPSRNSFLISPKMTGTA